jgi:transcriptional regulator with XRE-family HTH domain
MSQDFKRLGDAVSNARNAIGWTVRDLARQAGLSQATIHGIERGYSEPTQQAQDEVSRALGWAPGSIAAILQGGSPTIDTPEDRPTPDEIA